MKIDIKELRELELNNLGAWPFPMVVVLSLFISSIILLLGYWFDTKRQLELMHYAKQEEVTLKDNFEKKMHQAVNLPVYLVQMENMKKTFGGLLRQLPEKTEVPALVEDVSHQGLATGLEFLSIRMQPERVIDFYVELPIEISVMGGYHQFAEFISNVAALPRIVTLHDFVIHAQSDQSKGGTPGPLPVAKDPKKEKQSEFNTDQLVMNITAKTYRYISDKDNQLNVKESHAPK